MSCMIVNFLAAINLIEDKFIGNKLAEDVVEKELKKTRLKRSKVNIEIPMLAGTRKQINNVSDKPVPAKEETEKKEQVKPIVIEKNVGKKFVIELPANPATGYVWFWQLTDPLRERPVELIKKEYVSPRTGILGGEGIVKFTFKAMKVGSMSVVLVKRRLWEKNTDVDMRHYDVTVLYKRHKFKTKEELEAAKKSACDQSATSNSQAEKTMQQTKETTQSGQKGAIDQNNKPDTSIKDV